MKTQLIKLQDRFILVTDERVSQTEPAYYFCHKDNMWYKFAEDIVDDLEKEDRPIIASYPSLPKLPSIDFSLLSEEDCKTIGWVDVEKMAINSFGHKPSKDDTDILLSLGKGYVGGYQQGFKAHQELVKDKLFTIEDMNKIFAVGVQLGINQELFTQQGKTLQDEEKVFQRTIQSLLPKTEWDIEFDEQGKIKLI